MMDHLSVGFTGTQGGMTDAQHTAVSHWLDSHPVARLHHGDCVGADAQVHAMGLHRDLWVVIHPPTDPRKRAFCPYADHVHAELPYLDRNRAIVDASDILLATPATANEVLRSGTWATVRYARKQGKQVIIFRPDGTTDPA